MGHGLETEAQDLLEGEEGTEEEEGGKEQNLLSF